jgi:outer membrane protein OmpA-like peptidoglycan-associated protein
MKKIIMSVVTVLTVAMMSTSCSTMSNTGKGTTIGAGSGAALGALVGTLVSGKSDKGKGAIIGAAIGGTVGAGTGALIGKHMDKKAAALQEELANKADVETVTDSNGLTAIKVTFANDILFATGKSTLSSTAQSALKDFAQTMTQSDLINTDIQIKGHTDNTGSDETNQKLSLQRAQAVGNVLRANNVTSSRITEAGMSYTEPVADNSTATGRAQNRRVEVFVLANETMIKQAEAGNL